VGLDGRLKSARPVTQLLRLTLKDSKADSPCLRAEKLEAVDTGSPDADPLGSPSGPLTYHLVIFIGKSTKPQH
jgi:hypothetical protein